MVVFKPASIEASPVGRELIQSPRRRIVRIPTHDDYPSMNLSHAVSILCYTLLHHPLSPSGGKEKNRPSPEEIRRFLRETEQFLENVGFLRGTPQADRNRRILLEDLLDRSEPDRSELRTLWALLRKLKNKLPS